ncbi:MULTISPECIES: glycerophosphodiester phosphodiesterase family protein [Marivita]|uniref:Phosphodiesterase n=1 Tax=Marivita cryptomonadis TaxID=505252 RepID=A0A9Q2RX57_9RHOB|nr:MULTISPECIES: glycerophosphodiester phosphodiesterase family protein [Marivita]MCR9170542.1 phosphodiesterase [Paracoccaceae bacterium]MBM2321571.1 phosphodiesterase [Marivita cryptomonadis]MBM2331152.1 phosphodiesterase [Marivita cryptomonadis]MBM2340738.1 phosphodiesterase [Marivita cryptomonadis]MBM2345400.1 phosphodiesterase [Marivita cryptomonadis]
MTRLPPAFLTRPIAHRGYHNKAEGVIENSPSAFAAAIAAGYPIELDLQLSRDGVPMVFHDDTLERLTAETGAVRDRDAAELETFTLKGGTDRIPTLARVLEQVDGAVPLLIELKDQHGAMGETDGVLERAALDVLKEYAGPFALMSFNPSMIAKVAALSPETPRGIIGCAWRKIDEPHVPVDRRAELAAIPGFKEIDADFLSHDHTDLDSPRVEQLKAQGVPILCWTIRSPEQERQARKIADNITFEGYVA